MKTADLIKQIQACDPEGTRDVVAICYNSVDGGMTGINSLRPEYDELSYNFTEGGAEESVQLVYELKENNDSKPKAYATAANWTTADKPWFVSEGHGVDGVYFDTEDEANDFCKKVNKLLGWGEQG